MLPANGASQKSFARTMADVAASGVAFRRPVEEHEGAALPAARVPTALRAFWADGLFSSAQDAFILAYLPLLADSLGASATQIGLLAASQSLGSMLSLYPGAWAARHARSRRWLVILASGLLGRVLLLVTALAIALFHGQTALYLVIGIFTTRAFLGSFIVPAWTSLAADIIPPALRSRYFASRNFAISLAALALTPLAGLLLDAAGFPGGFIAALSVAFAFGMLSTVAYSRIPEPSRRERQAKSASTLSVRDIMANRKFRTFVSATFALQFATMIAGPFFNVYMKDHLAATNFQVGVVTTASAISGLAGQLVFGDMLARRGPLIMSRLSLLVLPLLPWMWLFVTSPWHVLLLNLVGGAAWAAFNLANFQHLLEITDESERESYVAFFHTAIFLALFLAPFLGGVIIDYAGYRPAFLVSGAGRCISTAMFFVMVGVPSVGEEARRRLQREPAPVTT